MSPLFKRNYTQMNQVGQVLSLFISNKESSTPIKIKEIQVDTKGIIGDKHYDTDTQRSVLITSSQSYTLTKKHHIDIPYGVLGENLLIDYNPYALPVGTKLQMGHALVEISQNCTLCNHLSKIDKQLPKLLKNDRGIFAKVIREGSIKMGDKIYLLEN